MKKRWDHGRLIMRHNFILHGCRMRAFLPGPERSRSPGSHLHSFSLQSRTWKCHLPLAAQSLSLPRGWKTKVIIGRQAWVGERQLPTCTTCLAFGGGIRNASRASSSSSAQPAAAGGGEGPRVSAAAHGERVKYHFKGEAKAQACEYITRRTIYAQARVQFDTGIMKKRRSLWMT